MNNDHTQNQKRNDPNKNNPNSSTRSSAETRPQSAETRSHKEGTASSNAQPMRNNPEEIKVKLKETWSRLSDEDIDLYGEKREQFINKLKEKYGLERSEAEIHLKDFEHSNVHSGTKAA